MIKGMSKREKILLLALVGVVVLLGWYKLIFEPMSTKNDKLTTDITATQEEIDNTLLPKTSQMRKMKKELEVLRGSGESQQIPLYDNSKELMNALHNVMSGTPVYDLQFGEPDADDYIVIHTINLDFTTGSYAQARETIDRLALNTFANQISDLSIEMDNGAHVQSTITFFEVKDESADSK